MSAYVGLDAGLRREVGERDRWRCRWCGRTNGGLDAHHIVYRSKGGLDVVTNLIMLCRRHHEVVHGGPSGNGSRVPSDRAAEILHELVLTSGVTGLSLLGTRRVDRAG